jgi:outer membrane protein assembly factor BamB
MYPYASAAASDDGTVFAVRAESKKERSGLVCFALDPRSEKETEIFFEPAHVKAANRLAVSASPVLDEVRKRLYVIANIDNDSRIHSFCLVRRKNLWTKDFKRFIIGTPALLEDGSIVVSDLNGVVHVVSPQGSVDHRYHTGAYYLLASPVCDTKGSIFIGDPEGKLHLVSPEGTGEIVFEARRSIEARLAFDPNGRLYLPSRDGQVYVFPQH